MATMTQQQATELENLLVEGKVPRNVAKARVREIKNGASPKRVFDLLFETQIAKIAKDGVRDLYRATTGPARRRTAFYKIIREILTYEGRRPNKAQARRNLAAMGIPAETVRWMVEERMPMTEQQVGKAVWEARKAGKSEKAAWGVGLTLAAQDRIIETAMRGQVESLGFEWTLALVLELVAIILAAIFGVIELIYTAVQNVQGRRDDAAFLRERQNTPLDVEQRQFVLEWMIEQSTWPEAEIRALEYIRANREGRRTFVGSERADLQRMWNEAKAQERATVLANQVADARGRLEDQRERDAAEAAMRRQDIYGGAGSSLSMIEAQASAIKWRKFGGYAVPAVIGASVLGGIIFFAHRG